MIEVNSTLNLEIIGLKYFKEETKTHFICRIYANIYTP